MTIELEIANEEIGMQLAWDDVVGSLIARRLESTSGKLNYNYEENSVIMQSGGLITNDSDRLMFSFQYPHAAIADGGMRLHIHWEQVSANVIEFTTQYRIQPNGQAKQAVWTTVNSSSNVDSKYPYVSGALNQITSLATIDLTGAGLSATVQFRVARTDGTIGDINATFIDAHIQRDMVGSREEYIK